jgi:GH24 family phage-related lysozyme (muramidase)
MTAGMFLEEVTERAVPPEGVQVRAVYPRGLALTKDSEGFRGDLYNDAAGYCTIAYGHLVKKARCAGTEPAEFLAGVSRPVGERLLVSDMTSVRWAVQRMTARPLSNGQFAALCDFAFNVGSTALRESTLLRRVNEGQDAEVPAQFRRWVLAGGRELPGLRSRREREIELYFDGLAVPRAAPALGEDLAPIDIRTGE